MSRYEGMIEAQARKAFPNTEEAEDFKQDVFLKAYESLSLFRGEAQFSTWLYQIARFQLIRFWKQKKIPVTTWDQTLEETTPDSSIPLFSETLEKEEDHRLLKQLIAKLPLVYRKPILLHYFENRPLREISDNLNIKIGTIKSHISRGKDLIRKWWIHENK
jgi:RNA polymerase sigma-70 factor, ECF subfamily